MIVWIPNTRGFKCYFYTTFSTIGNCYVAVKPSFPADVPTKTDILEHTSMVLNFTAIGNPADIKYNWFKGTQKVKFGKKRRKRDVSLPNITKVEIY